MFNNRTTELEAINIMLATIGESRVSSLDVSGTVEVAEARATLHEVSRDVQTKGWHFNTLEDYPLLRQEDGTIVVPETYMKVDVENAWDVDVVQWGSKLYDKKNHTYTFKRDLKGTVVIALEWDQLPQAAKSYIGIRAARIFQGRMLTSETVYKFSAEQEQVAYNLLVEAEGESGDYNMLDGNAATRRIARRY